MENQREIVLKALEKEKIPYEMLEHEAVYTVDDIERIGLWSHQDGVGAKNLFLRDGSGKRHYLIVIREDKQADLKEVRSKIGSSRLSFASPERLKKYLKVMPGSVSPFGILNDEECHVKVYFDRSLSDYRYIAVHPNDNTATVWMKIEDLVGMIKKHGNPFAWIEI